MQLFCSLFKNPLSAIPALLMLLFMAVGVLIPADTYAQRDPALYNYPQNHLGWYTIESDHFLVHFQEGSSRPAQVASRIAEEVYGPITELYGHEPEHKVSLLIIDRLDYSNGAAFFYDNKIEIWLPSLDTPLRGTHNWLRNVITHEFTHIVQLQASMKRTRRVPAIYLQWLSYEEVRRPDVLYGFPSGIISYPLAGISMPAWLAEGTAQYMHSELHYDYWDSHRDMLLRTRILDDNYLGLEKMGTFSSKTSLERELTYNQGFAFTYYLVDRFGEEALADITRAFSQRGVYDVRKAIREATGIDGRVVFNDWIEELKAHYEEMVEGTEKDPENRSWIEPFGFFNFYPAYTPDGGQIAYLSNKFSDGAMAFLYMRDVETDEEESAYEARLLEEPSLSHASHTSHSNAHQSLRNRNLPPGHPSSSTINHNGHSCQFGALQLRRLETSFSFSPDGERIAYSRSSLNPQGEQYRDLYIHDIATSDSERLTFSQRLHDPVWSPDGRTLAAGKIEDGSVNLFLYDLERDSLIRVTDFRHGEQVYRAAWHPDGDRLFFAYADTAHRGIYELSAPGSQDPAYELSGHETGHVSIFPRFADNAWRESMRPVLTSPAVDYRDPAVSHDGTWLYYSADHNGIFNIYRLSLDTGKSQKITNVAGGAFMPHPHPHKKALLYSEYVSTGYKIAELDLSATEFVNGSSPGAPVSTAGTTGERPAAGQQSVAETQARAEDRTDSVHHPAASQFADFTDPGFHAFPVTGTTTGTTTITNSTTTTGTASATTTTTVTATISASADDAGSDAFPNADRLLRNPHASATWQGADHTPTSITSLNIFDDTDLEPLSETAIAHADTGSYSFQISTRGSSSERSFYRYDDQFTTFQFYPVIRFDNYSRMRGSNSDLLTSGQFGDLGNNLWRDAKIGTYFVSREMLERFTIFGGGLIGAGSRPSDGVSNFFNPGRLVDLDRDLFLEVEYVGLPFLKRHWSPTLSVSFFNIRRNVSDGLQIEEFPCTSCMPDTTSTDIAYNMWQVEVNAISKLNRWSLLELGYYYSPYRVSTESFYSREFRQEVAGSTSRYYIGSTWSAAWMFDFSLPDRHGDIAPLGWRGLIRYRYEPSELLDSYDIRDGTLIPVYDNFNNHSVEIDLRAGTVLRQQRLSLRTRFFSYFEGPDEFFYLDYIGGMIGMRSYPYFALGGTTTAFTQLSWFVPLKTDIYQQMGRFTLDKVFLRLFAEAGNGWGGPIDIDRRIKTGAGAELRIGMNSYYFFPTSFFISGAYGFNSYDIQLPEAFLTEVPDGRVDYGNQLLINFGILFDFEF
ncbi:hypothetical protein QA596_07690 [Balneolales bacterium ANBcel1]|nr:hypothetical protein [Balneolales bacterium ANBcel1]